MRDGNTASIRLAVVCAVFVGVLAGSSLGADWPAYRHDVRRSGVTVQSLAVPLRQAWVYRPAQAPRPAWSPPHFIMINRLDFDAAPGLVIAGNRLVFGSSADDTVRALDARTGRELWRCTTGGPIRVAPQIADDRVYFGSDDGWIYCLDAATGKPAWTFNAAPSPDQIIGNDRLISRWPIRTGVLVDDDVAYAVAGMWATEGIYAYALDADTGNVIWCNDTAGFAGVDYNTRLNRADPEHMVHGVHEGDYGTYGLTPQGPLAAGRDVLLVPNGYAKPAGLDRKTGRLLFSKPAAGVGGDWMYVEGDRWISTSYHRVMRYAGRWFDFAGEKVG